MRRVCQQLFRFSTTESIKPKQAANITTAQQKFNQTPIHMRAYDKAKYEVPMKKIKKNSGYALLQIEPFPRARIMKICYKILQQIKIGIPEDCVQRIFIQQRTKYVMQMTDKIQDAEQIQDHFGTDSIQLLITGLARHLEFIQVFRKNKLWQLKPTGQTQALKLIKSQQSAKFPIYKKGERPTAKFLDV